MNELLPPPMLLDGAEVKFWAVSRRGKYHTIPHDVGGLGADVVCVAAMAICQYQGDERVYLFKCDRDWNVVFDWDAASVAETQEIAVAHAKDEVVEWQTMVA